MKIRDIEIEKTACLAPMAGVADSAFRQVCKKFGASYVVSEMASSKALTMNDKKTAELLTITENERPMAIQLFGDNPKIMAEATLKIMPYNPDIIDINMGCPVPKIAGNNCGSALMKNPTLASEIIKAVRDISPVPVSVKFRKGWDDDNINAVDFAKMCEQSGADFITIHGRTKKQMYAPPVDLDIIRDVKSAVSIPVIGNGDIYSVKDAVKMYDYTGCDLVMVGRGALGNPWIFSQIKEYFEKGTIPPPPSINERMEVMLSHIKLLCKLKGEYIGMKEARKHSAWYIKGVRGAASFRQKMGTLTTFDDLEKMVEIILSTQE